MKTQRSRAVGCSAWLDRLLRALGQLVQKSQRFIFCLLVSGVPCPLSFHLWATPPIKSHCLISGERRIEFGDFPDAMSYVKGLFFELHDLPWFLIENQLVGASRFDLLPQNRQNASESGSLSALVSSDGEVVSRQPAYSGPNRRPQDDLQWGYLHWAITALISFLLGMLIGYRSNEKELSHRW